MPVPLRFALATVAITLLLFPAGTAQTATTSLRGTISDPQAAVVQGANVTLSNPSSGFSRSTKTDDQGFYQFLQVPPGAYTLTVAKP